MSYESIVEAIKNNIWAVVIVIGILLIILQRELWEKYKQKNQTQYTKVTTEIKQEEDVVSDQKVMPENDITLNKKGPFGESEDNIDMEEEDISIEQKYTFMVSNYKQQLVEDIAKLNNKLKELDVYAEQFNQTYQIDSDMMNKQYLDIKTSRDKLVSISNKLI